MTSSTRGTRGTILKVRPSDQAIRPMPLIVGSVLAVIAGCILYFWLTSRGYSGFAAAQDPITVGAAWVGSERLIKHTCPSETCGVTGRLSFGDAAQVDEIKADWARMSPYFDAGCDTRGSKYIKEGNAKCSRDNGIVDGKFAEWGQVQYLSSTRPSDAARGQSRLEAILAHSDDFGANRLAFMKAARQLIDNAQCSEADFQTSGGFKKIRAKSSIYVVSCGKRPNLRAVNLDVDAGRVFLD